MLQLLQHCTFVCYRRPDKYIPDDTPLGPVDVGHVMVLPARNRSDEWRAPRPWVRPDKIGVVQ
jgi:hypothetical protein